MSFSLTLTTGGTVLAQSIIIKTKNPSHSKHDTGFQMRVALIQCSLHWLLFIHMVWEVGWLVGGVVFKKNGLGFILKAENLSVRQRWRQSKRCHGLRHKEQHLKLLQTGPSPEWGGGSIHPPIQSIRAKTSWGRSSSSSYCRCFLRTPEHARGSRNQRMVWLMMSQELKL